jgi:hypothetical protein
MPLAGRTFRCSARMAINYTPGSRSRFRRTQSAAASVGLGNRGRECPRPESNQCTRFRKPLLYPLSYGGSGAEYRAPSAGELRRPTTVLRTAGPACIVGPHIEADGPHWGLWPARRDGRSHRVLWWWRPEAEGHIQRRTRRLLRRLARNRVRGASSEQADLISAAADPPLKVCPVGTSFGSVWRRGCRALAEKSRPLPTTSGAMHVLFRVVPSKGTLSRVEHLSLQWHCIDHRFGLERRRSPVPRTRATFDC